MSYSLQTRRSVYVEHSLFFVSRPNLSISDGVSEREKQVFFSEGNCCSYYLKENFYKNAFSQRTFFFEKIFDELDRQRDEGGRESWDEDK